MSAIDYHEFPFCLQVSALLALVFWNARRRDVDAQLYADSLADFHRALKESRPAGFRYSLTCRIGSLPWFEPETEAYEDWYVLSSFAAIDALDQAVLHGDDMESHRRLMRSTGAASGAILGLSAGAAKPGNLRVATWFRKPANVPVEELVRSANDQASDGKCSLWTRALALGPVEHCLLSRSPVELPDSYGATSVTRELHWPD